MSTVLDTKCVKAVADYNFKNDADSATLMAVKNYEGFFPSVVVSKLTSVRVNMTRQQTGVRDFTRKYIHIFMKHIGIEVKQRIVGNNITYEREYP